MFSNAFFWVIFSVALLFSMPFAILCCDTYKKRIVWSVICILIAFLLAFSIYEERATDTEKWNEGKCRICAGEMNFSSATSNRYNKKTVYYTCDNCGHTESFSQIMK